MKSRFSPIRVMRRQALKTLDPSEVSRRGLDAYFYYMLGEDLPASCHYDNMAEARKWGFKVSDAMKRLNTVEEVEKIYQILGQGKKGSARSH